MASNPEGKSIPAFHHVWNKDNLGTLKFFQEYIRFERKDEIEENTLTILWTSVKSLKTRKGSADLRFMLKDDTFETFRFANDDALKSAKTEARVMWTSLPSNANHRTSLPLVGVEDMTGSIVGPEDFVPAQDNSEKNTNSMGIEEVTSRSNEKLGALRSSKPYQQDNKKPTIQSKKDKGADPNVANDDSSSTTDKGSLLYEIAYKDTKGNCLYDGAFTGEDSVLQFYEHLVILKRKYLNGVFPNSYEMKVIPRFKLVGATICHQAESVPSWQYTMLQFGILGLVLWIAGYIIFFVILLLGGINAFSTFPCFVARRERYF